MVSESHENISFLINTGLSVGFSIVTNFEIDSLTIDYSSIFPSGSGAYKVILILKKLNSYVFKFLKKTFNLTLVYFNPNIESL